MPSLATTSTSIPVSGVLENPCPPTELLAFEGRLHIVEDIETTPTEVTARVRINAQDIEGVGLTSGDMYRVEDNIKNDFSFTIVPPFEFQQEVDVRFRLIREGSDDNLWMRFKARFTFPPGTTEILKNELECRG
jgi:hypothetical protein